MITREVNEWIKKVECGMYSASDVMQEFVNVSRYLTKEEILFVKKRLSDFIK